jgi:hypothetical protein
MNNTIKEVFQSDWIITKVLQGSRDKVRIDARHRYQAKFVSKWVSFAYANKLCRENYNKRIDKLSVYSV